MRNKTTLVQARDLADKLEDKYNKKPWFVATCVIMEQDGNYAVGLCIPDWFTMSEEVANQFLEPINNIRIILRVIRTANYNIDKTK